MAREAHRYGMKALPIGDEFLYQDEMLRSSGARLSPDDDGFWEILRNRYRDILESVPELDGIGVRIGEMLPIGNIRSFDVIHNDSTLSIEEKYRRFVRTMYGVVVEEFDKLYYHRTWVVNDWEQHSVPSIFGSIFEDIPTRNLIVSIKLTKCDQWWYQAFNPTLGLTDHDTVLELEQVHGPHGSMTYPDYMGEWFEAGLKYALGRGAKGTFMGPPWNLWMDSHFYAAQRLMWQPRLTAPELARDWASRTFGRRAAPYIGKMLLKSDDAMRKALYIGPYASTHPWNPLEHLMTEMFVVGGDPYLDGGREHARFLREMYLLSKPQLDDTLDEMGEGLNIYDDMLRLFTRARPHVGDRELSGSAAKSLREGRAFLGLNVAYVRAFMNFFMYEDEETTRARKRAESSLSSLRRSLERYRRDVGRYSTIGIETFIDLAEAGLRDLERYRNRLMQAPGHLETRDLLARRRREDEELVNAEGARRILRFEADVDGAELLIIKGRNLKTVHIAGEGTTGINFEFYEDLPSGGLLAVKPLEARGWAYVVVQPGQKNGRTAKIMIQDPQNGRSVYKIEVYWIPKRRT